MSDLLERSIMPKQARFKRVSDYIAELCVAIGLKNIHGLMGGGASGLNDGFLKNNKLNYLCYHHEQSAGYAALAEARFNKNWALLNTTTGCGGTNAITPLLNAWQDSVPLVVVSGNVASDTCAERINKQHQINIRCYGVQECNIQEIVRPITKFSHTLYDLSALETVFVNAFRAAKEGRPGPVWIDIPSDIQHAILSDEMFTHIPRVAKNALQLTKVTPLEGDAHKIKMKELLLHFQTANRPLVLVGGGARSDHKTKKKVQDFVKSHNLPVVSTYAATDIIEHNYEFYLGAVGIKGNREANFAVQNCDCLIVLGSRLPFAAVGYETQAFAQNAKIIVVDIDLNELKKNSQVHSKNILQFHSDIVSFLSQNQWSFSNLSNEWLSKCKKTRANWNAISSNKNFYNYGGVSIYHVIEELNRPEYDASCFVVDAGSISYVAPVALHYNSSRDFVFSPAQADMGCALPSALGVASVNNDRPVYCITGDGSFMSNLQELATVAYHKYDVRIILLNNSGYLSISNTQKNNYGDTMFGEHDGRGITFPNFEMICRSFGIEYVKINRKDQLSKLNKKGPIICEVFCEEYETIAPYQTRIDGKQAGSHDMAPHVNLDELKSFQSVDLNYKRTF